MDKVVITGHTQGLGAALAQILLEQGANLLALSRSSNINLAAQYSSSLTEVSLDLSDIEAIDAWLATDALASFLQGSSTVTLLNNAGQVEPIGPPGVQGPAQVGRAVSLNVAAPLMLTDAFVAASNQASNRRVLHISSGAARNAYAGWSVYCATKAALDHHARGVAEDHVANLRIESLAPGVIDTQMQAQIRATTEDRFPARDRFESMKRDGALASAQATSASIVAHLLSDRFGQQIDTDIRQL